MSTIVNPIEIEFHVRQYDERWDRIVWDARVIVGAESVNDAWRAFSEEYPVAEGFEVVSTRDLAPAVPLVTIYGRSVPRPS